MRYGKSMSEALAEIREGFSKKEIKMAIGIASDPRYKQGNYSGAFKQIEKIKKGLASHPQVAAVLKRQNEEILEKVKCPDCEGEGCPKCEGNGYMADAVDKEDEPFLKDLIKNLRKGSATHGKQADDLEKAVKEETELDEMKEPFVVVDTADGDKIVGMASSEKGAKEIITTAQLPPMKIKDKKTLKIVKVKKKQMIGHPIKEDVEIDESVKASTNYDFDRLIKSGGLDKRDYQKAKNLYSQGKLMDLRKHIYNLDTEPTEAIMDVIGKNDPKAFMKMYPKSKKGEYMSSIAYNHGEENELDEGKMKAISMKIDSIVAKMKKDKQMKSFADKFKKEASKTLDIAKSLEKVLPDYIAGKDIAALVKEETVVESWELDEMKMDDPKLLKIFDKLKKGSTVKIKIDSSISKGKDYREFTVTAKNIVGKGKKFEQEKITLKSKDNPTGVKHFLYNRDGKVTLAIGDMGASIADIKEDNMSAYTAAITKGVK